MGSKSKIVPHLVVIEGHDKGKVIALEEGTSIIGRSKGDIIVHDPRMSRSHVAIDFDPKTGKVSFTDLKSLNGTFLNGEATQAGEIKDGDQLRVGETVFDCQLTDSAPKEVEIKHQEPQTDSIAKKEEKAEKAEKVEKVEAKKERGSERDKEKRDAEKQKERSKDRDREKAREGEKAPRSASSRPPKKESSYTHLIKGWYGKIPSRRRVQLLLALLVLSVFFLLGDDSPNPPELAAKIQAVRDVAKAGDVTGAIRQAEALREKYSKSGNVLILLGDLYLSRSEEATALEFYQRAKDLPPVSPVLNVHLMEIYLRFSLQAATDEDRNHWKEQAKNEYTILAESIRKAGIELSSAITDEKLQPAEFIRSHPEVRELFIATGELFLRFKELDEPVEQMILVGRALQRDIAPDSPVGYKLEAQVQLKLNQLAPAVSALEGALRLDSSDLWVIENLALAKYRLKDYAGAENVFTRWIEVAPDSGKAYLVMAYLKISQKDAVGAVPYLQKVIEIGTKNPKDPYYPEALYVVGQVMLQADRKNDAIQYVQESCRLGYEAGCKSPLLEGRVPTSPPDRSPDSVKKALPKIKKK